MCEALHGPSCRFPFVDGFITATSLHEATWTTSVAAYERVLRDNPAFESLPGDPPDMHWTAHAQEAVDDAVFSLDEPTLVEAYVSFVGVLPQVMNYLGGGSLAPSLPGRVILALVASAPPLAPSAACPPLAPSAACPPLAPSTSSPAPLVPSQLPLRFLDRFRGAPFAAVE
jgi:hypothetical protein